jgi:hypothetical protein
MGNKVNILLIYNDGKKKLNQVTQEVKTPNKTIGNFMDVIVL